MNASSGKRKKKPYLRKAIVVKRKIRQNIEKMKIMKTHLSPNINNNYMCKLETQCMKFNCINTLSQSGLSWGMSACRLRPSLPKDQA